MPASHSCEQDRLAGGVVEVLRDRRGERVRRLVAVVPGRDAQRVRAVRPALADRERRARPGTDGRPERRHLAQRCDRLVDDRPRRGGRARRPGWPPPSRRARHRWRRWRPGRAGGRAGRPRRTPGRSRSVACPPITPTRRAARGSSPPGPRRSRGRAGPGRARAPGRVGLPRPGVDPGVQRLAVRPGAVELVGGVERGPVGVDRHVGHRREHDAAAAADRGLVTWRRTRSRGTARRPPGAGASRSPRSVRSTERRCHPVSDRAPAASRRSSSSVDSTSTTRPRVLFTRPT